MNTTAVITDKCRPNPKRPGSKSHRRFTAYRVGETLEQYARRARIAKGQALRDAQWDTSRGYIAVSDGTSSTG